jgi:hypothetical protein
LSALSRARARLAARRAALTAAVKALALAKAAVTQSARTVARLSKKQPAKGPWMPGVAKDPVTSIGPSTMGAKAGCLHTTEGIDFAGADRTLKANGDEPHFLVGQKKDQIKQYRPITDAATALEHPAGAVETNRKHLVQIEVCAFAAQPAWPLEQKQNVARVMAYLAANGYPLKCSVRFTDAKHVKRLSPAEWTAYSGWLGHQHAPAQPTGHWDPGAIDISDLINRAKKL